MTQARNLADLSQAFTAGQFPGKNKIINPCGVINQRGVGSVTQGYSHDRWHFAASGGFAAKIQMTPANNAGGFSSISDNYFYVYCTTQFTALAAGDYTMVRQFIEGYNAVDLLWGTIFAKPITISFKATGTGLALPFTMGVSVRNNSINRSYVAPVVITGQGRYSVTIPGCIDGTWDKTNTTGLELAFCLGCGSNYIVPVANAWQNGNYIGAPGQSNVAASTTNTISLTDVQLEVGRFATAIDPRPYQQELALCQRYYTFAQFTAGRAYNANVMDWGFIMPPMRATPSAAMLNAGHSIIVGGVGALSASGATITNSGMHAQGGFFTINGYSGLTAGNTAWMSSGNVVGLAAEL